MRGLSGVFNLVDTHGLPLEIIILECEDRGIVVAWDEFIKDAREHGWTDKTIRTKVIGAVGEAKPDMLDEFTKRLELCLMN